MSYWSKDWTCSDCNYKELSKNRKCQHCGKQRPHPRACEAGPIDVTQELIEASEAISRRGTWKYFPNRDCYGITLTDMNKEEDGVESTESENIVKLKEKISNISLGADQRNK